MNELETLRRSDVFSNLSDPDLGEIGRVASLREVATGELLIRHGTPLVLSSSWQLDDSG